MDIEALVAWFRQNQVRAIAAAEGDRGFLHVSSPHRIFEYVEGEYRVLDAAAVKERWSCFVISWNHVARIWRCTPTHSRKVNGSMRSLPPFHRARQRPCNVSRLGCWQAGHGWAHL